MVKSGSNLMSQNQISLDDLKNDVQKFADMGKTAMFVAIDKSKIWSRGE
jgi:hypothetical protein